MNLFIIDGRVGREPEIAVTSSGKKRTNFSVAVRMGKDQTTWIDIQTWEKLAEFTNTYIHQGTFVVVQGHIDKYKYSDSEGKQKYVTNFVADRIDLGGGNNQQQKPVNKPAPVQEPEPDMDDMAPLGITPGDLPF